MLVLAEPMAGVYVAAAQCESRSASADDSQLLMQSCCLGRAGTEGKPAVARKTASRA